MAVVTLYSDASYCPHNRFAAYCCRVVGARGQWKHAGPMPSPMEDNNTAELYATVHGLAGALGAGVMGEGDKVVVYTDSYFSITRLKGRTDLRVTDTQAELLQLAGKIITGFALDVELRHVKGHSRARGPLSAAIGDCDITARKELNKMRNSL